MTIPEARQYVSDVFERNETDEEFKESKNNEDNSLVFVDNIIANSNILMDNVSDTITEYKEFTKFAESKIGICPAPFRVAYSELRDMKDSYAILPYPKWDESQEMFLTNIYDQYSAFSVPKTVYDDDQLEFAGIIIEALNAESYKQVYPAFYDIALKNKYTEDEDSARMVDIIMEGANMDFSYMFGETNMQRIPYLFRDCINNKKLDIASEYATKQKSLSVSIEKLYTFYENVE
jgi:hypothetical protein